MYKMIAVGILALTLFSPFAFSQAITGKVDNKKDTKSSKQLENNSALTEKTTPVSENTSQIEVMEKEAGVVKNMAPPKKVSMEPSPEMTALLKDRHKIILDLNKADELMNEMIAKSTTWDNERNTEKKGQLDTILDKADRLAFSNELRQSITGQAKTISALIKKLTIIEGKIEEQKVTDEKRRQLEELKLQIAHLEKEKNSLMEKIKNQDDGDVKVNSTQAVQKKREENVEYFTITEDTNLQTIALSYYQDHEKWVIIYEHPDNKKTLKQKSPTAIIPIGTVLTIPKMKEE